MKKIVLLIVSMFVCLSVISGCNNKETPKENDEVQNEAVNEENASKSNESSDVSSDEKEKKNNKEKSSKRKYDDISSESEPVGVEVSLKNESDYTYVTGRIYKNSDSPETGYITVTFELYDEEDNYICKKVISTEELLEYGEDERFSEDIIWEADDKYKKGVSDEMLEQYTVKIVDIEEISGDEAELNSLKNDIETAIKWTGDYETAQILLDDALGKYPDDVDLKLLQGELNKRTSEE